MPVSYAELEIGSLRAGERSRYRIHARPGDPRDAAARSPVFGEVPIESDGLLDLELDPAM